MFPKKTREVGADNPGFRLYIIVNLMKPSRSPLKPAPHKSPSRKTLRKDPHDCSPSKSLITQENLGNILFWCKDKNYKVYKTYLYHADTEY